MTTTTRAGQTEFSEDATGKFVQTAKWRLHYHDIGEGAPLVLLHGGGAGASGWSNYSQNIPFFAARYRVLVIDMPGWGQSDSAPPGDRDHAEALLLALDALGLERVAIVGNSMGGATAVKFTAHHPDRVSHLIPMGANAPGQNIFGPPTRQSEGVRAIAKAYFEPTPANFQAMVGALTNDPALAADSELARRRSEAALARPDHLENWRAAVVTGELNGPPAEYERVPALLAGLSVPTLLVHGREDRAVAYENSLRLLAMIPSARLHLFRDCGHWAQVEHSEEFNRIVHQFIEAN